MFQFWDKDLQTEIWYTIKTNKRRSILTSLGVFFGLLILTILLGLGKGISNGINKDISQFKRNTTLIFSNNTTLPYQGFRANRQIRFDYQDYLYIKNNSQTLSKVGIIVSRYAYGGSQSNTVVCKGKSYDMSVMGLSEDIDEISPQTIGAGRMFSNYEIRNKRNVCLLGIDYAKDIFGSAERALGQQTTYNGISLTIIGVVTENNKSISFGNYKRSLFVPLTFFDLQNLSESLPIMGLIKPGFTHKDVQKEAFAYFQRRYHIDPEDKDVIMTFSYETVLGFFNMISNAIQTLIWVIGIGTLLTGIISVSNILIVTVRERQREIGIRRALGAKPKDIVKQFISEAIFLIAVAGFAGEFLGLLILLGVGTVAEADPNLSKVLLNPYPDPGFILLSAVIILGSGVLAGLLPVYKALETRAIEAIRDE